MDEGPRLPPKRHRGQAGPTGRPNPPPPQQRGAKRGWSALSGLGKAGVITAVFFGLILASGISSALNDDSQPSGDRGEGSVALCDEPRSELEGLAESASAVLSQDGIDESGDDILREVAGLLPSGGPCAPWFAVYVQQRRAQP